MNESRRERIATLTLTAQVQRDGIHSLDNVRRTIEMHATELGIAPEETDEFLKWLHKEMLKGIRARHARQVVDAFEPPREDS
jgi:hypothetical protein